MQVRAPVLEQVWTPGDADTVYPVTGEPPVEAGAFHVTTAWAFPPVATTLSGGEVVVIGVTAVDGCEIVLVPATLVATTTNE